MRHEIQTSYGGVSAKLRALTSIDGSPFAMAAFVGNAIGYGMEPAAHHHCLRAGVFSMPAGLDALMH